MILYKNQALQTQKIFYEISLIISNFFQFNNINKDIQNGITDFAHGFKNKINEITNGTRLLIMSIYQNMIFQKIYNYTLQNSKHFKDIKNIIIIFREIEKINDQVKPKTPKTPKRKLLGVF